MLLVRRVVGDRERRAAPHLSTPTPTVWSSPELWANLIFLVLGAQVVTYVGFYIALSHWTSARVFAWTFLVPAVAVGVEGVQGNLPASIATTGLVVVIAGVALLATRA